MKFSIITLFSIILLFSSCEKEAQEGQKMSCATYEDIEYPTPTGEPSLCDEETCNKYFAIWQELIQEKNNLSQDFFDNQIEVYSTSLNDWVRGTSFRVCYSLTVDWAVAGNCDSFIITINPDDQTYPHLDLPRGVELTKEEVSIVTEGRAFSSSIASINNSNNLAHSSFDQAMNDLIAFAEVDTLCFTRLKLDKNSGSLILKTAAEYTTEENLCIFGDIDLFTGEKIAFDGPCRI